MASESQRVARWITQTLNADVVLMALITGVYEQPAKQGSLHPMVVFNQMSEVDIATGDSLKRIMTNSLWLVRGVVDDTSFETATSIADRLDTLLQNASGTADGADIFHCSREQGYRMVDDTSGKQFRHLGGIYRIFAQRI